ncbi:hemin transporter, partial [Geobacillus sp. MMMUD3]|nr:hemin transporter [Geobacillus sp. MMMUD3]
RGVGGAPDGVVSGWLFDNAEPGTVLKLSQPAGDVVLGESDAPLVLVSAGIGITPIAAIMEDLSRRQPDRTVRLYHADRSHAHHALYAGLRRQILAMTDAQALNWYEEGATEAPTLHPARSGFMDLSGIAVPAEAEVFMCGPLPFMQATRLALIDKGVPAERIHYEVFGPDLWAQSPK